MHENRCLTNLSSLVGNYSYYLVIQNVSSGYYNSTSGATVTLQQPINYTLGTPPPSNASDIVIVQRLVLVEGEIAGGAGIQNMEIYNQEITTVDGNYLSDVTFNFTLPSGVDFTGVYFNLNVNLSDPNAVLLYELEDSPGGGDINGIDTPDSFEINNYMPFLPFGSPSTGNLLASDYLQTGNNGIYFNRMALNTFADEETITVIINLNFNPALTSSNYLPVESSLTLYLWR